MFIAAIIIHVLHLSLRFKFNIHLHIFLLLQTPPKGHTTKATPKLYTAPLCRLQFLFLVEVKILCILLNSDSESNDNTLSL